MRLFLAVLLTVLFGCASAEAATWQVTATGSGTACTAAAPCGSFDVAYKKAAPGDVVEVANGNYASQTLTAKAGATAPNVVIRGMGSSVVLGPTTQTKTQDCLGFSGASYVTVENVHTASTSIVNQQTDLYPLNPVPHQCGVSVGRGGAHHITLKDVDAGKIWIAANDVQVIGGDYGPTGGVVSKLSETTNTSAPQGTNQPTNVTIDGARFHDFRRTDEDHMECMFVAGAENATIRNSSFENCSVFHIYLSSSWAATQRTGLIEGNTFTCGDQAQSNAVKFSQHSVTFVDWTVRGNTFNCQETFVDAVTASTITYGPGNVGGGLWLRDGGPKAPGTYTQGSAQVTVTATATPTPTPTPVPTPTPTPVPTPTPTPVPTPVPTPEEPAGPGPNGLRYAPPALTNPTTVQVPATGLSRTFAPTEDVILDLPDVPVTGAVATVGGDDIRVVGGKIGGGTSFNGTNGIVSRELRGSLYVEGVEVDFSQVANKDNIVATGYSPCGTSRANWSYPDVFIQNSLLKGSTYVSPGEHPDLYQKQGPQGGLFVDKVTGESSYQALMLAPQSFSSACSGGSQETYTEGMDLTTLSRINLRHRADNESGYLLWLGWDAGSNGGFSGEDPWPIRLDDVWVQGRPQGDRTLCCNLVWPRTSTTQGENGQDPHLTVTGTTGTWTTASKIEGTIRQGTPTAGDFVPAGTVGLNYGETPPPAYDPACRPDCDQIIAAKEAENQDLRTENARLEAELDRAGQDADGLREDIADLETQVGTLTTERDTARSERDAARSERDAALADAEQADLERDAALADLSQAEQQLATVTAERDTARTERDEALVQRDAAVEALQKARTAWADLSAALD
jgi:hypothetical protein